MINSMKKRQMAKLLHLSSTTFSIILSQKNIHKAKRLKSTTKASKLNNIINKYSIFLSSVPVSKKTIIFSY